MEIGIFETLKNTIGFFVREGKHSHDIIEIKWLKLNIQLISCLWNSISVPKPQAIVKDGRDGDWYLRDTEEHHWVLCKRRETLSGRLNQNG